MSINIIFPTVNFNNMLGKGVSTNETLTQFIIKEQKVQPQR